jgi:hypothetical protein
LTWSKKDPSGFCYQIFIHGHDVAESFFLMGREAGPDRSDQGNGKRALIEFQMAFVVLFQNLGLDALVDPEGDDNLGSDPEQARHFGERGHALIFPEEGGNGFLDCLDGSFSFMIPLYIELSLYSHEKISDVC